VDLADADRAVGAHFNPSHLSKNLRDRLLPDGAHDHVHIQFELRAGNDRHFSSAPSLT
jgi:hypothetical protein